jgi:hypothetical protein
MVVYCLNISKCPNVIVITLKRYENRVYAELRFDASRLNQIQVICQKRLGLGSPRIAISVEKSTYVPAWRSSALQGSGANLLPGARALSQIPRQINSDPKEFGAKKPRPQISIWFGQVQLESGSPNVIDPKHMRAKQTNHSRTFKSNASLFNWKSGGEKTKESNSTRGGERKLKKVTARTWRTFPADEN